MRRASATTRRARAVIVVLRPVVQRLLAEAAAAHPRECCGILLGGGPGRIEQALPAANVAADPRGAFEIDPGALVAAHKAARGGTAVAGYYHSHPQGPAEPSACDRACAAGDGRLWAIVAGGTIRFWRDSPGGFEPLSYAVIDG